ncbi:MAG: hypothetical protein VYE22_30905 [Myxococcota bacterium]|nr:hypothetical protein [Myxococcota bacterium]
MLRHASSLALCALLALGCDPGNARPTRDGGGGDAGRDPGADTDGDGIADADEGVDTLRDTDGDGEPDYLDSDSDGDGIPDSVEAGDDNPATPPRDSDGDGSPDFIDLDSDDNGIPDVDETDGDVDGDGTPDFADTDDDNDLITDAQELSTGLAPPNDNDGDGIPDYQDNDSDNDTILDGHERDLDTDGDGTPDVFDLDTDGDGIPDETEAGDSDVGTQPVDTDMDGTPDFRDFDSDNDGLSDADEVAMYGTSPTAEDSDGDGVSDLIEVSAGTDPGDGMDSPRTRGDFVFVVPFEEAPMPERDTLTFRTSIQFADIYFLFDQSGSMSGEINALRDAVTTVIGNLQCADTGTACMRDSECGAAEICSPFSNTCIEDPGMSSCILSPWTGTGFYEAYYENRLSLQADPAMTSARIRTSTFGGTEELYEALHGVVDPSRSGTDARGCTGPMPPGFVGCPSFRAEAVKILVAFTDEDSDGGFTSSDTGMALSGAGISMIGVWSGSPGSAARNELRDVVRDSGSLDRTGQPLLFEGQDSSVVPAVTSAINEIVEGVPLRVTIDAVDEPDDAGDSIQFIERLETNTTGMGCTAIMTEDSDGDGVQDTFPEVTPGTPVCFDVVARRNDFVMPTTTPQVFIARLTVYGDGSPLDSRLVYFLVPPEIEGPGGPM